MNTIASIALEANIDKDIARIYSRYPSLHGNTDVLRMLAEVEQEITPSKDEMEEKAHASYEKGEEDGYECCVDEWLAPLVEALKSDPVDEEGIKALLRAIERNNIL